MEKNKKFILLLFVISVFCAFLFELLIMNRRVLLKNNSYSPEILDMKGITKNGSWYKTTTDEAYIALKTSEKDNYINKINFDYHINKDMDWSINYILNGEEISYPCRSSAITTKAIKKLNVNADLIKIVIPHRNFRFKNLQINNKIYINLSQIIFITLIIFGIGILIKFREYFYKNLDKAFLFIVLIIGTLSIFIFPKNVYISWDDQIHLKNSYTLFSARTDNFSDSFKLIESKGKINNGVFQTREETKELYKSLNRIHKNTKQKKIQVNSPMKFNKFVYLPFYLGFKISSLLGLSFIASIILAKLFNFLAYVCLVFLAIRVSTVMKRLIFVVGLIPTNIFLATQFSYDPTITAGIILGLALFIRLLEMPKVNYKYILGFVLAIIWASLPKAIYAPLLLLILFIPKDKFKDKKEALTIKAIIIFIMLLLMSTFVLPMLMGGASGDVRGGNTGASAQLSLILHNPLNYIVLLIKYFSAYGADLALGPHALIHICYINYYIEMFSPMLYMIYLVFIMYVLYSYKFDKSIISNKIKGVFALAYIGISLLIVTALYLSFTEIGSNTISGVQHRYFNPLLLILLMVICSTRKENTKREEKVQNNILLLLIPFVVLGLILFPVVMVGRGM